MFRKSLFVCVLTILIQGSVNAATIYNVTDLGTLGGDTSRGMAINDNGTAVGYSTLPGGEIRAFIWTQSGGMQNLGSISGGDSRAFDINNADNVVGVTGPNAFRWTSGSGMVVIDGSSNGVAYDLNENSEIVGERNLVGVDRTIRWDASNTASSPFPTANTQGVAINDNNEFVGTNFGGTGYFSNGGPRTNLAAFIPTDLNNSREIVGSVGSIAALLDFDSSTTTLLGKLALSDSSSRALGINESGTIVGESVGTGAFIYDSTMGGLMDLTSLLHPSHSGWTILAAEDINNMGQIIGIGRFNGMDHAVVLTPVPEPSTIALGMGLSLLLYGTLRNRCRCHCWLVQQCSAA